MEQKQYWDSAAESKEFTTPFQAEEFQKYIDKDACILDVGCGYGRTLNELYTYGYSNLTGIDFSENMIKRGNKMFPYLDLRVQESDSIDFADESVDAVILFAVLTCICDDDAQEKLISEIMRVLKPNGIIYVNDFLLNTDERNLKRYDEFKNKYTYGVFELPEGAVCRHHDIERVEKLLSAFKKLAFERLTFTTMNGHKSNGFFYFGQKEIK